jgi:TolB-like protein/DNA-binding winged helix-turn-helix (wHTH) protein
MPSTSPLRETFRFADFELDVPSYELRYRDRRVRVERRPMDLLILMVERRGELITRAEIVERLWGPDVFIEIEPAVNTLVRKVRQALRDSADAPRFVETVPGKGYRFIAPVQIVRRDAAVTEPEIIAVENVASPATSATTVRPARPAGIIIATAAALIVIGIALWAWWPVPSDPPKATLAVLPFVAINVDAEREYLADALHEETVASLGQVDPARLHVLGRTSMLGYKGTTKSPAQIGQELGVEYLVETSIRTENARLRITPKLIRVRDQAQIWAQSYDGEPASMLEFQRDFGARIAEQIRLRLSPARIDALARRHTGDAEAYDLYLRGLYLWNQLKPETTRRAVEYYTRATARDPEYALAWAGLALAYAGAPINADAPPHAVSPQGREAAARAVQADPNLVETQTALGMVQFWLEWKWNDAAATFERAASLDPSYPLAQRMIGIVRSHQARHDEARQPMDRLRMLEPLYAMNWSLSAQVAFNARDYQSALRFAKEATVMAPEFWIGYYHLAMAAERLGQPDVALQTIEKVISGGSSNSKMHALRGYTLARSGRAAEARAVIETLASVAAAQYVPPYATALIYAGLDERDAAFAWLDRAYEARDVHLVALPTDAKWDALRDDPRFSAIMARCGFVSPPPTRPTS